MTHPRPPAEIIKRLKLALELPLLFHSGRQWDQTQIARWESITGSKDAYTKLMCDHIRTVLKEAEENGI
jgi:hypothetical protein